MAKSSRLDDVKVGVFVIAAVLVLVVGSLWIAGTTFRGQQVSYKVLLEDSGGVKAGDRVRMAGVTVGRVQRVVLRPGAEWPVEMGVSVAPHVALREDSTARIATIGLMGTPFLQIESGSPSAPALSAGGEIRGRTPHSIDDALSEMGEISKRAITVLEKTTTLIDRVTQEIQPLLENVETLLSEQNTRRVSNMLAQLESTAADAGPRIRSLLERLDSLSADIEDGTSELPELTDKMTAVVDDLSRALGPDGERLSSLLDEARASFASAGGALSVIGDNSGELEATLRDLRDIAANLKEFSSQIRERPHRLVRVRHPRDRKPGDPSRGTER
ncbi:MAG: MCE family protein [Acidobacteriota bacterium]|nr:MAG: MCE family protein [Acidobacteriota bacterium]